MLELLEELMRENATVKITTVGTQGGKPLGITGKITRIIKKDVNPAVVIQWNSQKDIAVSTGETAFSIPHIISIQRWVPSPQQNLAPAAPSNAWEAAMAKYGSHFGGYGGRINSNA